MLKKKSVYKCDVCGNLVEGLWDGKPAVACCGQPMRELVPNTTDAAKEKHVPVIVRDGSRVTVKVGEVAHPMTPEHYILFIDHGLGGRNLFKYLYIVLSPVCTRLRPCRDLLAEYRIVACKNG